jgi:hypothetical protein
MTDTDTDTNSSFINNGNQNYSGWFSDITVPTGGHTLPLPAQSGGYSQKNKKGGKGWKGGRKGTKGRRPDKSKIKNISNMYKMPARKIRKLKQTLRKKLTRNRMASRKKRVRFSKRHMRGGSTVSYAVGGVLAPSDSALANGYLQLNKGDPVPYNHFEGK